MPDYDLRKLVFSLEEVLHEGGPPPDRPYRRASALAIIANPFAGRYEPEIRWFMEPLKPLGLDMARRLVATGEWLRVLMTKPRVRLVLLLRLKAMQPPPPPPPPR